MEKYLIFKPGAGDSVCVPARELTHMHVDGDGESLDINFRSILGSDGTGEYNIDITIADNKGKEVMNAIADEIRSGKEALVVVIDDIAKEYLHSSMVSCGSISAIV
jgi:hypothetical protein